MWETVWVSVKSGVMKNAGIGVYGIYPEPAISYIKIGMILIGLRAKKMNAGLYSLRFKKGLTGWSLSENAFPLEVKEI